MELRFEIGKMEAHINDNVKITIKCVHKEKVMKVCEIVGNNCSWKREKPLEGTIAKVIYSYRLVGIPAVCVGFAIFYQGDWYMLSEERAYTIQRVLISSEFLEGKIEKVIAWRSLPQKLEWKALTTNQYEFDQINKYSVTHFHNSLTGEYELKDLSFLKDKEREYQAEEYVCLLQNYTHWAFAE